MEDWQRRFIDEYNALKDKYLLEIRAEIEKIEL